MDLMGIKYAKKKTEAPHHKKVVLGFVLDMKRKIAYLEPEWRRRFIHLNPQRPIYRTHVLYIGHVARRLCIFGAPILVLRLKEGTKFDPVWPPL
jgi:hypothetical protein